MRNRTDFPYHIKIENIETIKDKNIKLKITENWKAIEKEFNIPVSFLSSKGSYLFRITENGTIDDWILVIPPVDTLFEFLNGMMTYEKFVSCPNNKLFLVRWDLENFSTKLIRELSIKEVLDRIQLFKNHTILPEEEL